MRLAFILLILLVLAVAGIHTVAPDMLTRYLPTVHNATQAMEAAPPLAPASVWIAGVGRVEPVSEEIDLAFEISGLIESVTVNEGDRVHKGQVVAELQSAESRARLETAQAELEGLQAEYDRTLAGARKEEKSESWLIVQRTRVIMDNANTEMQRRQELLEQTLIAPEEVDRATTEFKVAKREHEEAMQRYFITLNQSRKEDILLAEARLKAGQTRRMEAEARLNTSLLRSPLDGTVLRRYRHPGENVSIFFASPVLRVGDISRLNIRAEIDETNFNKIAAGQRAFATCDAFGNRKIGGTVLRVTPMMGTKQLLTESPTERMDSKVVEVIITLDSPSGLVSGLIMDVFINTAASSTGELKSRIEN